MAGQPRSGHRLGPPPPRLARGMREEGKKGEWRNARSLAVNEGGAIKSRACVEGGLHRADCRGEGGGRQLPLRLSEERRERERAQINLLSRAWRTADGRDGPLAGRADEEDGDDRAR